MKLQILVNHYKENFDIINRFLDSIKLQTYKNFEVIICSDGGDVKLTKEFIQQYQFPIKYAYLPHSGVCHTRNVMLDDATADYVMFCDIDDMFSKEDGLESIMKKAEETNAQIVGSPYIMEYYIKNQEDMKTEEIKKDAIRVHGKVFNRQYLIDNKIRFPDELEYSGDMMFLWLAFSLTKKIAWIDNNFYIWKWNPNSITRRNVLFHISACKNTLKCYSLLAEDLKKRNRLDIYQQLIPSVFSTIYVWQKIFPWNNGSKEVLDEANQAVNEFVLSYFDFYKSLDEELRKFKFKQMLQYYKIPQAINIFDQIIPWFNTIKNSSNVLIIGYGIVGHNLEKELSLLSPAIYDKYKNVKKNYYPNKKYSIAFICVDTPKNEKSLCDTTEVKNAIMENNADIFVLKSTILPGTVDKLCEETGKKVIFSPEYYGETQHCNNFTFDYTILGGDKVACRKVQQILQKVYDGRHIFRIVDAKTAELVKYMENSFLATKVSFCQQFFNLAEQIGVDYEELRELFILDPRVNPSHTFVYRDQPWWDSKCLNKDVPAIAESYNAPLLLDVIKFNENQKK